MRQIPPALEGILVSDPETLSGAIRFAGTRVFAYQLFDYALSGRSLHDFLEDFPGVDRRHAEAALEWMRRQIRDEFEPRKTA